METRRWGTALRELAIGLGLTVFTLLLGFAGLEIWLARSDLPRDPRTILVPHPRSPRLLLMEPGEHARFTGVAVRVNRYGYRGPDWPLEKPRGTTRIAILGDSETFGYGVREEDSYPAILERRLAEQHGPGRFDVLNFAIEGYNTEQEAEACTLDVLRFHPDLVLVGFFPNDLGGPLGPEFLASVRAAEQADSDRASAHANPGLRTPAYLRLQMAGIARRFGFTRGSTTAHFSDLAAAGGPEWQRCTRGLVTMHDACRAAGARFGVVLLPFMVSLDSTHPTRKVHERIAAFCAAEGIACLDLLPAYMGRSSARLIVSPLNNHVNAEGNRIAAETILAWLGKGDLLARP